MPFAVLLFLACPLMLFFMMKGAGSMHGNAPAELMRPTIRAASSATSTTGPTTALVEERKRR